MGRTKGAKSADTEVKIAEAAVRCLSRLGLRRTTLEAVANEAGVTAALVLRYTKNSLDLFDFALSYIIRNAQSETAAVLHGSDKTGLEGLNTYIDLSISLYIRNPDQARIYALLYGLATHSPHFQEINTKIKRTAESRIRMFLNQGNLDNSLNVKDVAQTARFIHDSLVGMLLCSMAILPTELSLSATAKVFKKLILSGIQGRRI